MSGKKIIVVFAIFLASLFFLNKDICIEKVNRYNNIDLDYFY